MKLTLNPASTVAPYEQVRAGIAARIESGKLVVGERLPPIRQLADELGLAAGTVARAYRELEGSGLVVTRGRNGTQVATGGDQAVKVRRLAEAADVFAAAATALGVGGSQALRAVEHALGKGDT